MPIFGGTEVLTLTKANEAQALVQGWFRTQGYEDRDMPVMYEPGHEGPMYVLSLEGEEDWPFNVCEALRDKWPAGVFAEPVTNWCLGLYPA